jgi:hypothetical protein
MLALAALAILELLPRNCAHPPDLVPRSRRKQNPAVRFGCFRRGAFFFSFWGSVRTER